MKRAKEPLMPKGIDYRAGAYNLDERKQEILSAIVKVHVTTGQPVGSFTLAKQSSEGLSSATMRNI